MDNIKEVHLILLIELTPTRISPWGIIVISEEYIRPEVFVKEVTIYLIETILNIKIL